MVLDSCQLCLWWHPAKAPCMDIKNPHWGDALTVPFRDKKGWAYFPGVLSRAWLGQVRRAIPR